MNSDLVDEINYLKDLLAKSGFFSSDEILEILEDQFIEENIDFSQFKISSNNYDNANFTKIEKAFASLTQENIVTIHNCGYDIEEGVEDVFELYVHLINNNYKPTGFCFYTFEDIEEAITENRLKITFGDFEKDEKKALEIGKIIQEHLNEYFDTEWDESINTQIEINSIKWDKSYNSDMEYELEGAYESFIKNRD